MVSADDWNTLEETLLKQQSDAHNRYWEATGAINLLRYIRSRQDSSSNVSNAFTPAPDSTAKGKAKEKG